MKTLFHYFLMGCALFCAGASLNACADDMADQILVPVRTDTSASNGQKEATDVPAVTEQTDETTETPADPGQPGETTETPADPNQPVVDAETPTDPELPTDNPEVPVDSEQPSGTPECRHQLLAHQKREFQA